MGARESMPLMGVYSGPTAGVAGVAKVAVDDQLADFTSILNTTVVIMR